MRTTANLATIDDLVNGGSQFERSRESSSLMFDCSDIHLLKLLIMSIKMYASMSKNAGSIKVSREPNNGCSNDNRIFPLSVVSESSRAIPNGKEMRSNPIWFHKKS